MQGPDSQKSSTETLSNNPAAENKKNLRLASTTEVRAMLTDLSLRPLTQREFLCKLLKRAAVYASTTDSVVLPAESHPTSTS